MEKKNEYLIQITSGQKQGEFWRTIAHLLDTLLNEARTKEKDLFAEVFSTKPAYLKSTKLSATILLRGRDSKEYISKWQETIQSSIQSLYKANRQSKDRFVGIEVIEK